jgi:hypothetical protein
MMVKIQLEKGTMGSREFLQALVTEGENNMDIFLFKSIQRILLFKSHWLFNVMVGYFLQYFLYLVSLMVFPLIWPDDFLVVMFWMFFQIGVEWIQITSSGSFSISDYLNVWNFADVLRILLMALYVVFTILYRVNKPDENEILDPTAEVDETSADWDKRRAEVFTLLVLVSSFCMLQYFRLLSQFRALIKMIIECTKECLTFMVVLTVLLAGFTFSTYYRQILMKNDDAEE